MEHYTPLEAFIKRTFYSLSPSDSLMNNWHVAMLSHILEMVHEKKIKRLIVCMPPRYLKSVCISVAFPAWVLGSDASKKIIVASYAMPLAEKLSVDTKNIMQEPWFQEQFPKTKISTQVHNKRKFMTDKNGFRLGASVNGSLTGEGGDILIADDPQKPLDCMNKKYREKTYNWLLNTFFSRLNNKKHGAIVIVMQRLHKEDLVGKLTDNKLTGKMFEKVNGWNVLNLSAVAEKTEEFRNMGEVLNEKTENIDVVRSIEKQIGEHFFQSQYQQKPKSSKGFIKKSQMFFCDEDISQYVKNGVFVSVDCAFKTGENNDFTAITLWVAKKSTVVLFDVILAKMELIEIQKKIEELMKKYSVLQIIIEDKASGISLIQALKRKYFSKIVAIKVTNAKDIRFCSALPYLESGQVIFTKSTNQAVITQITEFPNVKHDDAVDSISQFVNWYFIYRKEYTPPHIRAF
jgi:predicted phage terminase large subunit-like protein